MRRVAAPDEIRRRRPAGIAAPGSDVVAAADSLTRAGPGRAHDARSVLALQRAVGNAAVGKLLRHPRDAGPDDEQKRPWTLRLPGVVDWVEVVSWSLGTQVSVEGPGGVARKNVASLTFTHESDADSVTLLRSVLSGPPIKHATLTGRSDGKTFIQITMDDVFISSMSRGGRSSAVDSVTLQFAAVHIDFPDRGKTASADQLTDDQSALALAGGGAPVTGSLVG
jgi:type VI protein secretion system component Hcp